MRRFDGRRALVTGASRGIGAALARRLAALGADVAISARTLDRHPTLPGSLQETASDIGASGVRCVVVVADMTKEDDRARIVPSAVDGLGGPVDILINNAAAAMYQRNADYPLRRRRLTFEVNVHGPLDLAQAVIPSMVERGEGWIVNVSSASARPTPGPPFEHASLASTVGIYGASKAALNRLTNALAVELYGTGVRVNTIEPRVAVATPGMQTLLGDVLTTDMIESMDDMVEATLMLCECGPDVTGSSFVSLDLLAR
jgi:NAD(P)-dependent dehydrogenase (short-subunit alcohol dehydrogenase family)